MRQRYPVVRTIISTAIRFCSSNTKIAIMKYLNVAEKNDAAKNISSILSRGASNRRNGLSVYNKIYEFGATVFGQQVQMVMTSVSGHLLNYSFTSTFRNWQSCNPIALFDAPVIKTCQQDFENIKKTLEREIRSCQGLIIWTDCDREGENIGFEIIKVCTDVKPNLQIYRAKFSEITAASIFRALNTLGQPNKNISDAVDVRMELDLRTGAAFTRLQTLRLQKVFPHKLADNLVSYGSCQFPTLGFVVERYQSIEKFIAEPFWRIKMNHKVKELTTEFSWKRDRLFDKNSCEAILDICKEAPQATVESVDSRSKSKWRPLPLDTVEMEKSASKKLKINAKDAMKIAEKLYTQGFISYPRTETNIFPKELDLSNLVNQQRENTAWGPFAQRIMNEGGPTPRQGKKTDQAHPPIHPTKYTNSLTGNENRLYEFIVRHFLACVHKDAEGFETTVNVDIAGEKFTAKGLIILEKNYLDVYIYEKWNAKEINNYQQGDRFMPTVLDIVESSTAAPRLLTEAELIALMEKHGIGTDATHAEHIETIKSREYVGLLENIYFVPGTLGMGLVEGYNRIGLEVSLAKPNLRAEFENDLKLICDGVKNAEVVRLEQVQKYKSVFQTVADKMNLIDNSLATRLDDQPQQVQNDVIVPNNTSPVLNCPKCGNGMVLRNKKTGGGKFLSCTGFPGCKNAVWFPTCVDEISSTDESCEVCGPNVKKILVKFKPNPFPGDPNPNTLCIGGCDLNVLLTLGINEQSVRGGSVNSERRSSEPHANQRNFNNQNQNFAPLATNEPTNSNFRSNLISNDSLNSTNSRTNILRPSLEIMPGPSNTNRRSQTSDNVTRNEDIVCSCNHEAVLLTVRKEGPNTGRKFYKCANNICDFFLWEANEDGSNMDQNNSTDQGGTLKCNCNLPVISRTVSKAGPNTGRKFYSCSKPIGQGCNFFKWCDEVDGTDGTGGGNDDGGGGGGGGGGRGGGGRGGRAVWNNNTSSNWGQGSTSWRGKTKKGKNFNKTAPYNNKTRAKRKCGICGEEGAPN